VQSGVISIKIKIIKFSKVHINKAHMYINVFPIVLKIKCTKVFS